MIATADWGYAALKTELSTIQVERDMTALNHTAKTPANFSAHTPRNYTITLNPTGPYAPNFWRGVQEKEWRKDFGVKFLFLAGEFLCPLSHGFSPFSFAMIFGEKKRSGTASEFSTFCITPKVDGLTLMENLVHSVWRTNYDF